MPVYKSHLNDVEDVDVVCNIPVLPLKTKFRGPGGVAEKGTKDIVDEAILFFRANIFMSEFQTEGNADNLLIYLTLCIQVFFTICIDKFCLQVTRSYMNTCPHS